MQILMKPSSAHEYFAVIYRIENKKIVILQMQLIDVLMRILERLMKGMTFEFSINRIFELEEKK